MKVTKPMLTGFMSLWIIVAYLIHPILSVAVLLLLIATLDR